MRVKLSPLFISFYWRRRTWEIYEPKRHVAVLPKKKAKTSPIENYAIYLVSLLSDGDKTSERNAI
jgi:hypothetical protein